MLIRCCDGCRARIEQEKLVIHPRAHFGREFSVQMMMPTPTPTGLVDLKEVDLCAKCVERLMQVWEEVKSKVSEVKLGAPFPGK